MRKTILLWSLLCIALTGVQAQTIRAKLKAIDDAWQNKNYFAVMEYIRSLPDEKQADPQYLNMYAESAADIFAYQEADRVYGILASMPQKMNYPLTDFKWAMVKKHLGEYENAIPLFERFLAETAPNEYNIQRAEAQIEECRWAQTAIENSDQSYQIHHLDDRINSPYTDFGAIYYGDTLFFSSLRFEREEPMDADNPSSSFYSLIMKMSPDGEEAEIWDVPFNTGDENVNAHLTFSPDQKRLYFNRCVSLNAMDMRCAIYYSDRQEDGKWSKAIKLPENINMPMYTATQPSVGYDRARKSDILYFVSDRPGGEGETDIWYSLMQKNGNWSDPVNLYEINTSGGELTPYFHTPSQILYFSSDGRRSYGGFDVYKALRKGRQFDEPIHLPAPVNSSFHDWHYSVNELSDKGTFASNRSGGYYLDAATATCCNDIYEVSLQPIEVLLDLAALHARTLDTLESVMVHIDNGSEVRTMLSDTLDLHAIPLLLGEEYTVSVTKSGFIGDTVEFISTLGIDSSQVIGRTAYLMPEQDLQLLASVFDQANSAPINGAKVTLEEMTASYNPKSGIAPLWQRNYDTHQSTFPLQVQTYYRLIAEKDGYVGDTVYVSETEVAALTEKVLEKRLFLSRKPAVMVTLQEYMPLPMYFDNDYPDPNSRSVYTNKSYEDTYFDYMDKKELFMQKYQQGGFSPVTMENFFEQEVRLGYESMRGFFTHLEQYLASGNTATLVVKGFASPRADSRYNLNLTHRRTQSLINYIRSYRNGIFEPYVNSGQLRLYEKQYGESKAPAYVSDDYDDERASIYSIDASRERRAEILEVVEGQNYR